MIQLKNIAISSCGTFHEINGKPLYNSRFLSVLKFASNYFAAVLDNTGAYHINVYGNPAYTTRFDKSYGFYCDLAAVSLNNKYFHIRTDGNPAYHSKFSWVGNFQEDLCVVKDNGKFYHIDQSGQPIYQEKYNYVGDFKDGIAVVYKDGFATHIDNKGQYIHNKWFKQLDIYHKGYARAEDDKGWFHIDKQGNEIYSSRYKNVEPFYNDLARIETFEGAIVQINPVNEIITVISQADPLTYINQLSNDMVGFWKTFIMNAGVKLGIFDHLPANLESLAKKIGMPQDNLIRILRALWEINLLTYYSQKNLWDLTEKGKLLKKEGDNFLGDAVVLWANVAAQNWLQLTKLLRDDIKPHPSFKDNEIDDQNTTAYLKALEGYAIKDVGNYFKKYSIQDKKIIGFGRTSLGLIKNLINIFPKIDASVFLGCKAPIAYLNNTNIQIIEDLERASVGYDIGLLLRFLHYFDDNLVLEYLAKMHHLNIKKLLIFETLVSDASPLGGLLDINMIIETGGKLRSLEKWIQLFKKSQYSIVSIKEINPYLTLLEVEL